MRLSDSKYLRYQHKWLYPYIRLLLGTMDVVAWMASLALLVAIVFRYGFVLTDSELALIRHTYSAVWVIFLVNILTHMLLHFRNQRHRMGALAWTVVGLYLLTLVPVVFHRPDEGPVLQFWLLTGSHAYRMALMVLLSLMTLANSFMAVLGRRVNPSLILAISFLAIILVGSGLLLLPRCSAGGLSWLNALFLSTSAVCVTGLSPVDITAALTHEGLAVLALLFQVGGLGVMTFTSFFAMFFMGNTSIYNQMAVRDMMSAGSLNSLLSLLLYVLGFTVAIEAAGALLIWTDIHGTLGMTVRQEAAFAVFHSVSAFCNAGFSTLPGGLSDPLVATQHTPFFLYISLLVVLGGLGFPILVNFKDILAFYLRKLWHLARKHSWGRQRMVHHYNVNTRIVLRVSGLLLAFGTLAFAIMEWDNTLAGRGWLQKCAQALFMSACTRSGGFTAADPALWTTGTMLVFFMLMAIGGGSQSTAGGIKVNAFAAAALGVLSVLRGTGRVEVFGRELSENSVRRSFITVLLFFSVLFAAILLLGWIEPQLPLRSVVMECMAALSTCGVGLGATPMLGIGGKVLIIVLMFIGRLGLLTVIMGLMPHREQPRFRYPKGEIIIN